MWQVLGGLSPGRGITGRAFTEARLALVDDVAELRCAAAVVSRWPESGGEDHRTDAVAHLAHAAVRLERADTEAAVTEILLDAATEISGLPDAMAVRTGASGAPPMVVVRGPHREALLAIHPHDLSALAEVVVPSRSCYSAGDEQAVGMVGTDALRGVGMRSVVVVPVHPYVGPAMLRAGVSIGLSAMPQGGSTDAALHAADHRLYEVKRRRAAAA